jgi:hypothetical protein
MVKKSRSGSGMSIPDHISESLETFFWLKYLNSLMRMRIRDKHPGCATLHTYMCRYENQINCGLDSVVGPILHSDVRQTSGGDRALLNLRPDQRILLYQDQDTAITVEKIEIKNVILPLYVLLRSLLRTSWG